MLHSGSSPTGPHVLLLEESSESSAATERTLQATGLKFNSVACHSKEEFQERILREPFDVIIGGFGLPGWHGLELLRWLHLCGIVSPYIMVAPQLDAATALACLDAGASSILGNRDSYQLRIAVHRALRERQLRSDRETTVTQLVESEEKFSKSFRLSPLASAIATLPEGRFVDVNDAFVKMTGFSQQDLIGRTSQELGIWADRGQRAEMLQQLEWGDPVHGIEMGMRNKAGESRTVKVSAELIHLGAESCVLSLLDDITETKRLEEQFRQAQKMEAVGLLSGGIAHDFNNLLGIILGNVELVTEKLEPQHPVRQNLDQIRTAVDDGVGLCRNLLSFSRKRVSAPSDLDLNDLVRDLHAMLRRVIGEDVALVIQLPLSPAYIRADRGLVNQAILNLIVNSRDAMPQGGRIVVRSAFVEQDAGFSETERSGSHVLLSINDIGTGMDAPTLAQLFKPFFTTKTEGRGTGLGLVMVKGLMAQCGGEIQVESQLGKGTTVKLFFPSVVPNVEKFTLNREPLTRADGGDETILLVEDNHTLLDAMTSILAGAGYTVLPARDLSDASGLLRSKRGKIRLILTDLVLPSGSGRQLVKEQARAGEKTKVLYMSGYPEDHFDKLSPAEWNPQLLVKPFSKHTLLTKVRSMLDERTL